MFGKWFGAVFGQWFGYSEPDPTPTGHGPGVPQLWVFTEGQESCIMVPEAELWIYTERIF